MAVGIGVKRKAVEIEWDVSEVDGETVTIEASNCHDKSTRETDNDGHATVTYPAGYHGTSKIKVIGSDGGSDTGVIKV